LRPSPATPRTAANKSKPMEKFCRRPECQTKRKTKIDRTRPGWALAAYALRFDAVAAARVLPCPGCQPARSFKVSVPPWSDLGPPPLGPESRQDDRGPVRAWCRWLQSRAPQRGPCRLMLWCPHWRWCWCTIPRSTYRLRLSTPPGSAALQPYQQSPGKPPRSARHSPPGYRAGAAAPRATCSGGYGEIFFPIAPCIDFVANWRHARRPPRHQSRSPHSRYNLPLRYVPPTLRCGCGEHPHNLLG
jgi:hypothetical protein